jgi:uncharacterized protein YraI
MRTNGRSRSIVTLLSVMLLPVIAWGSSSEVTASRLNVRTGPGTNFRRIGSVTRGTKLETKGKSGSWVKVDYRGRDAWVHGRYLKDSPSASSSRSTPSGQVRYVTAARLNVRSGPSTRYRRIGALDRGSKVSVIDSSGSWRKVTLQSGTGWVHGKYLSSSAPSSSSSSSSSSTSSVGFIQLPASGVGFYSYSSSSRRWGKAKFVYGIQRVSRRFITANPGAPRLGVGDISYRNGGRISGHKSHQKGVDGDFRPIRNDRREDRVLISQSAYSRSLTQKMLDLFVAEMQVKYIFFNDSKTKHTQYWPNHANHFHVRIYP